MQKYEFTVGYVSGATAIRNRLMPSKPEAGKEFSKEDMIRLAIRCWNIASRPEPDATYNVNEIAEDFIEKIKRQK